MSIEIPPVLLTSFMSIFKGHTKAYGRHVHVEVKKGKKEEGMSWTSHEGVKGHRPLDVDVYQDHLEGKEGKGIGIIPIDEDNKCSFVVLDVDIYDIDLSDLVSNIYKNNFPLICFRTKSGGLHIYCFFKEPILAKTARRTIKKFIPLLGLGRKTEIIPKQDTLMATEFGTFINAPYYNWEDTKQYMYNENLEPATLYEAIHKIATSRVNVEDINNFYAGLPFSDAPPCLQALYINGGVTDFRNNYLYNLAVYFKNKYENNSEFEEQIIRANSMLKEPLPLSDLNKTMLKSVGKEGNTYSYKCKEQPICDVCDKKECRKRDFGLGNGIISKLNYGQLTQFLDDPPYYEWVIDSVIMSFSSEQEIINQDRFRQLSFRMLGILPNRVKQETWDSIVNGSLKYMVKKKPDIGSDISPGAMLKSIVTEFLIARDRAQSKPQIKIGKVWHDDKYKCYCFDKNALVKFIFETKKFTALKRADINARLKAYGLGSTVMSINGKSVRVATLPDKFIDEESILMLSEEDIKPDFKQYDDEPF